MKCAAYIRVSTKEQDEHTQLNAIQEFTKQKGLEITKFYIDKGESGTKPFKERPNAKQLLEETEKLGTECIIAWSLDRIGRSMLDTLQTIIELENRGIRVITVKEEFLQTLDPNMRKLILSILAWVAEYERRRIRERQEEAWRQGKQKGRPQAIKPDEIRKLILKYPELAKHNKKALWYVAKSNGHKISYSRFTIKVNQVLKELGWW